RHVAAAHEPRAAGDLGRAAELPGRHPRSAVSDRREEHRVLRRARARLRLSDPAHRRSLDERGAQAAWDLLRIRVPAGRDPAGRCRSPLEDLLRRELHRRLQHDPWLGTHCAPALAPVAGHGDAVARARVDVGERRRNGDHLPRCADEREQRAVRGGGRRRRRHPAEDLARHAAAAARRPSRHDDSANHRDRAGVPRAVPLHVGRPRELDADGAAVDLQLRVRQLARRRLREGDGAQPDARGAPRSVLVALPSRDAFLEHGVSSSDDGTARIISQTEWTKPSLRYGVRSLQLLLLFGLLVFGLGPILWLAKSAITPTNDTITHPIALFPHGFAWSNLHEAWSNVDVARYFWNTVFIAFGSWLTQLVVATTGGYVLSVLRPKYARYINALLLATLFVPAVVLLVPLYVEIVRLPIVHHSLIN